MLEEVTVIIPTYNRPRQLLRLLDYYSQYRICILIADSTIKPFQLPAKFKNVEYYHFPNYPYVKKLPLIYKKVKTKYVVFCADDDFVAPIGIEACVDFLEKNPDYISAHGHYLRFHEEKSGKITAWPTYLYSLNIDINSNIPSERINQLLSNYAQLLYAVVRTKDAKKVYSLLEKNKQISNDNLVELTQAILLCIFGKSKILPVLYDVRESTPNSAGTYINSLEIISIDPKYKKEYNTWLQLLIIQLQKQELITKKDATVKIMKAINLYLKDYLMSLPHLQLNLSKLKNNINNLLNGIPAKITNYLRYYDTSSQHIIHQKAAKMEYKNIKKYIIKYADKSN